MKNLAIVDIGSNSIKLVLAEIRKNNSFKIIDELKETVRLGEGMTSSSKLKDDRMNKAIQTLKMFKNLCVASKTDEIIAVATAAVREASNQGEFLDRVETEVAINVEVLSGKDEGYYDYWGVANSLESNNGLIMDIGGGSIELIWMKDRRVNESISLPFGALDLTQRFDLYDSIDNEQEEKLKSFLKEEYQKIDWLSKIEDIRLIGVGGTIRNIAKIDQRKKDRPLKILHHYEMKNKDIYRVFDIVKNKNLKERKKISGLSKKRADIFIGASAAVAMLIDFCSIEKVLISGNGIREGLIYNHLCNDSDPVDNIVDFSIHNIINNFDLNENHAEHVYQLTDALYQQLKPLFNLNEEEFNGDVDKILKVAAMLHDSGSSINYYDHHEHSFYMILNSGINGLNHRELLLSAYIAASHRHNKYKLHKYNLNRSSFKEIINKKGADKELIRKLGILLEIAESLDRNMNGLVTAIECKIDPDVVVIKAISEYDIELEINDALETAKGFKKLFNRRLIIF